MPSWSSSGDFNFEMSQQMADYMRHYLQSPAERLVGRYTAMKQETYLTPHRDEFNYRVERDPSGALWLIVEQAGGPSPYLMNPLTDYSPTFTRPSIQYRELARFNITHGGMKRLVFELIDMVDDLQFTSDAMDLMEDWTEDD